MCNFRTLLQYNEQMHSFVFPAIHSSNNVPSLCYIADLSRLYSRVNHLKAEKSYLQISSSPGYRFAIWARPTSWYHCLVITWDWVNSLYHLLYTELTLKHMDLMTLYSLNFDRYGTSLDFNIYALCIALA